MGFREAISSVLVQNYATFQGRASRSELWYFSIFVFIVGFLVSGLIFMARMDFNIQHFSDGFTAEFFEIQNMSNLDHALNAVLALFYLVILIPTIAVTVRRLHDRDMSGWWYLGFIVVGLIPFIGFVAWIVHVVIIFFLKGTDGDNRFGPDPLRPSARADLFA